MSEQALIKSNEVPFRDLQQRSDIETVLAETKKRPWMVHWPPRQESSVSLWANSDSPEVLSWRYDPKRPFDRPWRSWTRTPLAKQEPLLTEDQINSTKNINSEFTNSTTILQHHYNETHPVSCTSSIDHEILDLQLSFIETVKLNYLAPLDLYCHEKPYLSRLPFLENLKRTNIVSKTYPVSVFNISGNEAHFKLDISGFSFARFSFPFNSWSDEYVQEEYVPALTAWLKSYFQSPRVIIYAYNFRGRGMVRSDSSPWKSPFFRVHCDATSAACKQRLCLHNAMNTEESAVKRYRFINIWRPLTGPGQDCPLALCDFRSVHRKDIVESDIVFPHYCDEGYELRFNPAHRWFYKGNMSTDEIILFKLDDSSADVAQFCAHSAFKDPTATRETPPRASIEARAIIIDEY